MKWIRTLACAICGKQGGIHTAHLRAVSPLHGKLATGIAQKPDDSGRQDKELQFWKRHGNDPFVLALALWRASGNDELAFLVINELRSQARTG